MSISKIRDAQEDLDSIMFIERSCFSSQFPSAYIALCLKVIIGIFLVAEVKEAVSGYSLFAFRDDYAHLLSIAALPAKGNFGI